VSGFRVWIATCEEFSSGQSSGKLREAVAIEPAEEGILSAAQAACYVKAFNRTAVGRGLRMRAVALPVVVRYEGDLQAGRKVAISG
jgi:hypothetical protein